MLKAFVQILKTGWQQRASLGDRQLAVQQLEFLPSRSGNQGKAAPSRWADHRLVSDHALYHRPGLGLLG